MDLSLSNLGSLTHWWNFISSMVIPLSAVVTPALRGSFSINSLSFIPASTKNYLACIQAFHWAWNLIWLHQSRQISKCFPCLKTIHWHSLSHQCISHSSYEQSPMVSMKSHRWLGKSVALVFWDPSKVRHWSLPQWCSSWEELGLWTEGIRSP